MAASTLERTVLPPDEPLDSLLAALDALQAPMTEAEPLSTTLTGPDGEHLVLPAEVFEVLRDVVAALSQGQAVTVAPVHQRLTTQQAADLLGISRPTFVKLLDDGEIPYLQPGRHRRVLLSNVLAYRERRSAAARESFKRMAEIAHEAGMHERTATPWRTR